MRTTFFTVLTLLLIASTVSIKGGNDNKPLRYVENDAFGFGERLEYDVGYSFVNAGTAVFQVSKKKRVVEGHDCFLVAFTVKSNPDFEFVYKVRNQYLTWIDIDGLFPWQFMQRTRERNFKKDYKAIFDQNAHKAVTTEGTFDVPSFVHDIVSAFYYVRTQDLSGMKRGESIKLKNFFDRETHDLQVKILGREQVTVKAGVFDCVVIEPIIVSGSPFGFKGRLVMWMTDDDRKIPVKVATHIPIGTIDAELKHYQGTRGKVAAKVK